MNDTPHWRFYESFSYFHLANSGADHCNSGSTGEESNHDRDDLRATTVKPAADPSGPPLGPDKGTLVLCSTQTVEIRDRFIALAGGHDAHIVVVINPMQRKSPLMRGLKSLLQTLSDASSAGSSAIANSERPPQNRQCRRLTFAPPQIQFPRHGESNTCLHGAPTTQKPERRSRCWPR